MDLTAKPFYLDTDGVRWVQETLASMTEEEKIGQLFAPAGFTGEHAFLDNVILARHAGGIMFRETPGKDIQETHRYLQEHSKIPMLLAANLEAGGNGIASDGTYYGSQMQAAATGDVESAYRLGKIACTEGAAVGCNWAFAPVTDIDVNWRNPITNVRTYGSDPEFVKKCVLAYKKGADEAGVAISMKHFPGDGVDEVDQHILTSVNSMTCEEWDATYGAIYSALIEDGALTCMVGHIAMPAYQRSLNPNFGDKLIPATLSPELLQGLLREKLGFNGMIVTDSTVMIGFNVAMERSKSVPYAIAAGCDMFLMNKDFAEDYQYMIDGYHAGILTEERLNEAVTRILATKAALGLHKKKPSEIVPGPEALSVLANDQFTQWAKACADQSITLVKDTQSNLPISPKKTKKVLLEVLGDFPSNDRVKEHFGRLLEKEGFEVEHYVHEVWGEAKFDVHTFREKYDMVIYLANVENASNKVTNRLNWFTFWGNGNNIPWFVCERPVIFISLANPYHLIDVPMVKTFVNCYDNSDTVLDALIEKLTGRSEFKGKSPVDPFLGKEYLRY